VKRDDLIEYLLDYLADDGLSMSTPEVGRVADLAIADYSLLSPLLVETAQASVAGTLDYDLPAGTIGVLTVVDADGVDYDFALFNRKVRLATDPGGAALTLTTSALHTLVGDEYPAIPDHHLAHVGDLAYARILERLADDIAKRPAVRDGQTSEDFGSNARDLARRATLIRATVGQALDGLAPVIG
jgi:hypothetical protein